jgi:hypothetical protein
LAGVGNSTVARSFEEDLIDFVDPIDSEVNPVNEVNKVPLAVGLF